MMDCRLPRHPDPHKRMGEVIAFARQQSAAPSLIIAAMARAPLTAEEARTAAVVRAGLRDSEVAMIGRPPELLARLQCSYRILSEGCATDEQRDHAAQHLILCTHKPWRILAANHMAGRKGLTIGGTQ